MIVFKKVILACALVLTASCSSQRGERLKSWMKETDKLKILSTTVQLGDLVSEIGGDRVNNLVLIEGELDPHSYELVKGDDEKLSRADLIFCNGLGLEHGASLSQSLKNSRTLAVAEKIALLAPDRILKRQGSTDPHLWMDVSLWKKGVEPIVRALSEKDPEGATYYRERGAALEKKMDSVHERIRTQLLKIPANKRYLVTSHDAFQYFSTSYLSGSAAPEGLAPDGQLSPVDIRRIISFCKEHEIEVLFPESNVSQDSIMKIASAGREMGLDMEICPEPLYGDGTGGFTYLEMMEKNGDVIARYLQ